MLRHFLNATARTSSRSLFTKPNPLFSGGLNYFSTSSRSLLGQSNATVHVSSLRSLPDQKLCASEMYPACMPGVRLRPGEKVYTIGGWKAKLIVLLVLGFFYYLGTRAQVPSAHMDQSTVWPRWTSAQPMDQPARQLTSIVPLATKEPDLREWTRANMEFKMIDRRGAEMPPSTYFWSKAIVAPVTMPKLKEILDDLKSNGARVEESDNYYFVDARVGSTKKRFAELMIWLEEPDHKYFRAVEEAEKKREENREAGRGGYARDQYSWNTAPKKPSSLPKTARTDSSCYMGA